MKNYPTVARLLDITLHVLTAQNLIIKAQVSLKGENWASLETSLLRPMKDYKKHMYVFTLAFIFRIQFEGKEVKARKHWITVLWQGSNCIKVNWHQTSVKKSGNASYIVFIVLPRFCKKLFMPTISFFPLLVVLSLESTELYAYNQHIIFMIQKFLKTRTKQWMVWTLWISDLIWPEWFHRITIEWFGCEATLKII